MARLPLTLIALVVATNALAQPRHRAVPHRCGPLPPAPATTPYAVRFDQLGYLPTGNRWAVVLGTGQSAPGYQIFDLTTNCAVRQGVAGPRLINTESRARKPLTGDRIDLSTLPGGRFLVVLEDGSRFGPINVADDVYFDIIPSEIQFLRIQRCGLTDAQDSMHASCHLFGSVVDSDASTVSGDGVAVDYGTRAHFTSASGPAADVEGGWHDAGDFVKFAGTTSFTLTLHLLAIEHHPDYFLGQATRGSYYEYRREMRWGLDWLLKMIDRADPLLQVGGEGDHVAFRLPEDDTKNPVPAYDQRPAVRMMSGAGRNILGRSAASFALGASVFEDDTAYSARLLAAARSAYQRAVDRPAAQSSDPARSYEESSTDDDIALAAACLYRLTHEETYRADALRYALRLVDADPVVGWSSVASLAISETAATFPSGSPERIQLRDRLVTLVQPIADSVRTPSGPGAAFGYALRTFGNGSIAESLGAAAACLAANRIEPKAEYLEVARTQLHWLFGANPFGVSFMIGLGQKNPQHPHHWLSAVAGKPVTGAIVGGPSRLSEVNTNPSRSDPYAQWSTDALLYEDVTDDYVVNEPAIDFPAPLVYVLSELLSRD